MTEVSHRDDPGRLGVLTGKERDRSDGRVVQVRWFDNTTSWVPEYQLVHREGTTEDAYDLLRKRRFGRLNDLRRNLTHIHLSGRLANVVYSMDTTNTDFYAYQYKPVLTFLESPSRGILIADEVGLGKTIEAGLIWTELRARYDARRLLVVCPAMLREKWCDELRVRFGVEATILNAQELLRELRKPKADTAEGKGLVCSLQGLRPPTGWQSSDRKSADAELARFLDEQADNEPCIDLLIIDEAHYLRNAETQSAVIGRLLRDVSENVVLLSATPINNKERDLFQLLTLVDPDTFSDPEVFPQVLEANEPLIKARASALDPRADGSAIQEELRNAASHPLLLRNKQLAGLLSQELDSEYLRERANRIELADRIERINLLRHTVNRTRKVEVHELRVVREPFREFVPLDPNGIEWQFYQSVTDAVRNYGIERGINDGFLLAPPQRQVSSCMYAAAKSWADRSGLSNVDEISYEDFGADDTPVRDVSPLIDHVVRHAMQNLEIEKLREVDSKYRKLRSVLSGYFADHPAEKIVVFSYFRGTLKYLSERLAEDGMRTMLLYGGMGRPKQEVIDRFRQDEKVRVLLTSEVASEGVDLQFCRVLVNYDLPWNPMKIEQRIGRIDRIGQAAEKINIWNIGCANTIDERIHDRLLAKLNIFERALGGMEAILGEIIQELASDLLSKPLTPEQESKRIDEAFTAAENNRKQQESLEANAGHLIAHAGYILERVKAAHEFQRLITGQDLKLYFKDYLDRYVRGFEFRELSSDPSRVQVKLPADAAARLDEFIRRNRLYGQTRLATGERIQCTFRNSVKESADRREETISQFHPVIRFVSEELQERGEAFFPLVAVRLDDARGLDIRAGVYAVSVKRWTFSGLQMYEELQARAIALGSADTLLDRDESWELVNIARTDGKEWLSVANEVDVERVADAFDECDVALEEDYDRARRDRMNENEDRVAFQLESTSKHERRLIGRQRELLDAYRAAHRANLIPMTEGRIRKIQEKFAVQMERLKQKGQLTSSTSDVVYGLIKVK